MESEDESFLFMDCIGAVMVEEDVAPAPTQISQPPSDSVGSDTVVFHAVTFMI
jgi:hypothetical protein